MEDILPLLNDIRSFLWFERTNMIESHSIHPDNESANSPLYNFSRAFKGMPDGVPATYAQECLDFEKQHKDDAIAIPVPGASVVLYLDNYGNLIISGGGRAHVEIPLAAFDAAYQQLPKPGTIPDPVQWPPASDTPIPGASSGIMSRTPPTNAQMSMQQNEATLRWLKTRKR